MITKLNEVNEKFRVRVTELENLVETVLTKVEKGAAKGENITT